MEDDKAHKLSEVTKELSELAQMKELEAILKNNFIEFDHNGKKYKVSKPTPGQLRKIQEAKAKKYTHLAMDDDYLFEEQLKKTYKKKGVDIDSLDFQIMELERKEQDLMIRLAKQSVDKQVEEVKNMIIEVRNKKNDLFLKKNNYLQYSIEAQVADYANEMLLSTILEVKNEEDKFEQAFKTHDELLSCPDQKLIVRSTYFLSLLVYQNDF